jgi:hypothetical protein
MAISTLGRGGSGEERYQSSRERRLGLVAEGILYYDESFLTDIHGYRNG